ncbi:MAG: dynamin family protein, partial [Myxococcota bacterium]
MSDDQQHDKEDELGRDGDASPDEEDAPEGLEDAEESVSEEREVQDQFVGARAVDEPADVTAGFTTSVTEAHVADLLTEIGEIAAKCGLKSLEREVVEERLPALSRGRITLVVLGEFNHGKSTVVNALLGDDVLPVGITPTTAVITHLVYAEEASVTVRPPHDGEPFEIGYDEMERAVKESGDEGEEPEYIEIGYPNEVLQNSLVLVDTPGVNDISRQKVEITYGYLPRADVILYVLDATQVLKKSEVTFIRDRLLKANRDRILFVLNKIDALSPQDVAEVEKYARERLEGLIGPVELFSFSGREALLTQQAGEETPEAFQAFQSYLLGFLHEQRAYIILDSALAGGLRISALLEQNLAIKRQGYSLEREDLERRIQAVRARLKESRQLIASNLELIDDRIVGIAGAARHNLRVFTEQFIEQLPMQIERAEARDVKRYLPAFIQDTYKEWLEKEGQEIARNLEELAEEVIQITNESLQQAV